MASDLTKKLEDDAVAFHCNFMVQTGRPCGCQVREGWVTSCAHIFCEKHAKEWFNSNMDCPVCCNGKHPRVMKMSFERSPKTDSQRVLGLFPNEILQAAGDALEFWAHQKSQELIWDKQASARFHASEAQLQRQRRELQEQVTKAVTELQERRQLLKQELSDSLARRDKVESKLRAAKEHLRRVTCQCAALEASVYSSGDLSTIPSKKRTATVSEDRYSLPTAGRVRPAGDSYRYVGNTSHCSGAATPLFGWSNSRLPRRRLL